MRKSKKIASLILTGLLATTLVTTATSCTFGGGGDNPTVDPVNQKATVSFVINGETKTRIYDTGFEIQSEQNIKDFFDGSYPKVAGKTFDAWYTDAAYTTKVTFPFKITGDVSIYAKYVENSYTVKFNSNGGSAVSDIKANANTTITKPNNPTKDGFTFGGWYTDAGLSKEFSFTTAITANTTLYAKWNVITYTVTFNTNGGSSVAKATVNANSTVTLPNNPTKTGYTFAGWYTDAALTTAFDATTKIKTNTALYAKWTQNAPETPQVTTFKVTYNTNGGSTVAEETLNSGAKATKPTDPTKTGYTFAGWFTDNSCTTAFDFTNTTITANTTLYAKWTINTYTVVFNVAGGSEIADATVNYNTAVAKPTDPTKTGYDFKGWYSDEALSTAFDFTTKITADTTIYAKWALKAGVTEVTVTFNSNGGSPVAQINAASGSKITAPTAPTKDNSVFDGWYTDSACTTAFDFTNTTITANITLYAKWISTYTVTFNTMGGSSIDPQTVNHNGTATEPTAPTKDGCTFFGWFTDESCANAFDFATPITENTTLYAGYNAIPTQSIAITAYGGYTEGAYLELPAGTYTISYKKSTASTYTAVDSQLVRTTSTGVRCDILGLSAGDYTLKVTSGSSRETVAVAVGADDRSGYAHFNNTNGVGAYKNDGTLKDNAVVVYVTDETKNTVTATISGKSYTGLGNILAAANKFTVPVDIRILGTIKTTQFNRITYTKAALSEALINEQKATVGNVTAKTDATTIISNGWNSYSTDLNNGITTLNGLTSYFTYGEQSKSATGYEYDSCWNMMNVSKGQNITVEGVGTDAGIFQWGFVWKECKYIEVKNLTFDDYPEDGCSFEGTKTTCSSSDTSKDVNVLTYGWSWIHNCTFEEGSNNWDLSCEKDKNEGDGSADLKYVRNITLSYNKYVQTHKTGLVGGSENNLTANITFHHNYYDGCKSRMPYARQANMHMYNNYYKDSTGTTMQIYAGAYAFIENCYFKNDNKTFELDNKGYKTPAIKSYNNTFSGSNTTSPATAVTNRETTVSNGNLFNQNFDTDSTAFYYDATNKKSNVSIMTATADVPTYVPAHAGAGKMDNKTATSNPTITTYTVTFNSQGGSTVPSQTINVDSTAVQPTNPTKNGYTFGGWYTEATCTNAFNFATPITAATVLYAKWTQSTPTTYTVTFDSQGGSSVTSQNVNANSTATTPTAPTKSGYTFGGWYTEAACTNEFNFSTPITASKTLYAKWTAVSANAISESITYSFRYSDNANYVDPELSSSGQTTIGKLTFITTSKFQNNTTGWTFFNSGSKIKFTLAESSSIVIGMYNDSTAYTVSGNNITTGSGKYYCGAGEVTITSTANGYIGSLEIVVGDIDPANNGTPQSLALATYVTGSGGSTTAGQGTYVSTKPKTIYKVGETFSTAGIYGVVTYSNEQTSGFAASDLSYSAPDMTTAGTKNITLKYTSGGETVNTTLTIYVVATAPSITDNTLMIKVDPSYTGTLGTVVSGYNTFKTIQQALDYLKSYESQYSSNKKIIEVMAGTYNEKLEITIPNLTIKGAGASTTTIEWNSLYGYVEADGFKQITDSTMTVAVREAAENCTIEDITISNYYNHIDRFNNVKTYNDNGVLTDRTNQGERGLALLVQSDKLTVKNSRLLGWQDTVELFKGRQLFLNTYICGSIDYLFGYNNSTYFKGCTIETVKGKSTSGINGYVTAFKGNNKSSSDTPTYAVVFDECNFTVSSDFGGNVAIMRPWAAYSNVAVINSTFDSHFSTDITKEIISGLFSTDGNKTVDLATIKLKLYNNTLNGAAFTITNLSALSNISNPNIDSTAAASYTMTNIFATTNGGVTYSSSWSPSLS